MRRISYYAPYACMHGSDQRQNLITEHDQVRLHPISPFPVILGTNTFFSKSISELLSSRQNLVQSIHADSTLLVSKKIDSLSENVLYRQNVPVQCLFSIISNVILTIGCAPNQESTNIPNRTVTKLEANRSHVKYQQKTNSRIVKTKHKG